VGAFPQKFSTALAAKLLIGSKNVRGCKNGTDLLYHHAKYMVGIVGRAPAVDQKVWCFFLFVTLSNDKVCDNGNAIKHCNCQNNYSVIAQRKVCSCAPIFKFSYRPPKFRGANFYQKLPFFGDFWDRKATFLKLQWSNLAWMCSPGTPSSGKILYKSNKGIYPFWGKFIPKITILAIFRPKVHIF